MGKRTDTAGWNNRFNDKRFKGFQGTHGANIFPWGLQAQSAAAGADGTYDGTTPIPTGSVMAEVQINVITPFDAGAIQVGSIADPDALVTLADAVDLTTPGVKTVTREVIWPALSVVRTTISGGPSAGAAVVTVSYDI